MKYKNKKNLLIIAGVLAVVVICTVCVVALRQNDNNTPTDTGTNQSIDYSPATKEDKDRAEANKDAIVARDQQDSIQQTAPVSGSRKLVTPVVTYAGQYSDAIEVGGYVSGIFESDGVCTATFSKDAENYDVSVGAVRNAQSVDCPTMSIPSSKLQAKGQWSVRVGYTSPMSQGTSSIKQFEVK